MPEQDAFDFGRRDLLAAADDNIFQSIADLDVTVGMNRGGVAGMKPAVVHRQLGSVRVLVVPFHHYVPADHDFTNRLTIFDYVVALFIDDTQLPRGQQFDSLT